MNDLAAEVRGRARYRCEYCHIPQAAFRRPFHIEHIIALQHGGQSDMSNLAFACWRCNLKKGPNLAGIDSQTGDMVPLIHPRNDNWSTHFAVRIGKPILRAIEIRGLTPVGRATAFTLLTLAIPLTGRFGLRREPV